MPSKCKTAGCTLVAWYGTTRRDYCVDHKTPEMRHQGDAKCSHGRRKSRCAECGGSALCEHGLLRELCVECGGGSICSHGRRRQFCVACGGGSVCEHKRERARCVECGGSGICHHRRVRAKCVECDGTGICEHGKRERLLWARVISTKMSKPVSKMSPAEKQVYYQGVVKDMTQEQRVAFMNTMPLDDIVFAMDPEVVARGKRRAKIAWGILGGLAATRLALEVRNGPFGTYASTMYNAFRGRMNESDFRTISQSLDGMYGRDYTNHSSASRNFVRNNNGVLDKYPRYV